MSQDTNLKQLMIGKNMSTKRIELPGWLVVTIIALLTALIAFLIYLFVSFAMVFLTERQARLLPIQAEAQAQANKIISGSIDNKVLQWVFLEKWDGEIYDREIFEKDFIDAQE